MMIQLLFVLEFVLLIHFSAAGRGYKGRGAQYIKPTAAVASFCCDGYFSPKFDSVCGVIKFEQLDFPGQPTVVDINLNNTIPGDYEIAIHYFGDTSDHCWIKSARRYHLLDAFTIFENATQYSYWAGFNDHDISVTNHLAGIIGRAISVSRRSDETGEFSEVRGCEVIGVAEEEQSVPPPRTKIWTYNPLPDYYRALGLKYT